MHFHAKSIEVAQVQYSSNTELKHMQTLETIQSIFHYHQKKKQHSSHKQQQHSAAKLYM